MPAEVPGLHRKFAKLEPAERAIKGFADRYGGLGRFTCVLFDPDQDHCQQPTLVGEPLDLWVREIHFMNRVLRIWDLARGGRDDERELRKYIKWRSPLEVEVEWGNGAARQRRGIATFDESNKHDELLKGWVFGREVVGPARMFVHHVVNKAMEGHVSPKVAWAQKGKITLVPDDLLTALYVHFALEISGRSRAPAICQNCGRFFTPKRIDQIYCDESCRYQHWYSTGKKKLDSD
jgi:hypothetical protein